MFGFVWITDCSSINLNLDETETNHSTGDEKINRPARLYGMFVVDVCVMYRLLSVGPHLTCPLSLQLPNQTRMESGPEVVSQPSSLLPISGFPMQVRPTI